MRNIAMASTVGEQPCNKWEHQSLHVILAGKGSRLKSHKLSWFRNMKLPTVLDWTTTKRHSTYHLRPSPNFNRSSEHPAHLCPHAVFFTRGKSLWRAWDRYTRDSCRGTALLAGGIQCSSWNGTRLLVP